MSQYLLTLLGLDTTAGAKAMQLSPVSGVATGDTVLSATIIAGSGTGNNVTGSFSATVLHTPPPATNIVIDGVSNANFNYIIQGAGIDLSPNVILALMQRP